MEFILDCTFIERSNYDNPIFSVRYQNHYVLVLMDVTALNYVSFVELTTT